MENRSRLRLVVVVVHESGRGDGSPDESARVVDCSTERLPHVSHHLARYTARERRRPSRATMKHMLPAFRQAIGDVRRGRKGCRRWLLPFRRYIDDRAYQGTEPRRIRGWPLCRWDSNRGYHEVRSSSSTGGQLADVLLKGNRDAAALAGATRARLGWMTSRSRTLSQIIETDAIGAPGSMRPKTWLFSGKV
jgi:hypothetical protein